MTTLDLTVSKALAGQPVGGERHRLRGEHETTLRETRRQFQDIRSKAEMLRADLEVHFDAFDTPAIDTQTILAVAQATLPEKLKAKKQAIKIQEAFRLRHGLTRSAKEPQTAQNLLFLGILVFCEAAINAGFFQSAHLAASPLAALLISLLISITNVSVSTCAGYFIGRWKNYGAKAPDADAPEFNARRWTAKAQFWAFIAVMALFHVTVGLVRSLENLERVEHSPAAYLGLLTTPEALFLLLTGACLSVLAYHKGMHAFDDTYPGYGERHRAVLEAEDGLLDLFDEAADQIDERFGDAREELMRARKTQNKDIGQYNRTLTQCRKALSGLEQAASGAESGLRTQIAQLAYHHRAVAGDQALLPESPLDQPVSLGRFLDGCELPDIYRPPDLSERLRELDQARSDALHQLSTLFQDVLERDGEKQ